MQQNISGSSAGIASVSGSVKVLHKVISAVNQNKSTPGASLTVKKNTSGGSSSVVGTANVAHKVISVVSPKTSNVVGYFQGIRNLASSIPGPNSLVSGTLPAQIRLTQSSVEVVYTSSSAVRLTQAPIEIIYTSVPNLRSTQMAVEVIYSTYPVIKWTQFAVEALAIDTPNVRLTSQYLEVAELPSPNATLTQFALEVATTMNTQVLLITSAVNGSSSVAPRWGLKFGSGTNAGSALNAQPRGFSTVRGSMSVSKIRFTQLMAEALVVGTPNIRFTKLHLEAVVVGVPVIRFSQIMLEVLWSNSDGNARLTHFPVEFLTVSTPNVRVTHFPVEFLITVAHHFISGSSGGRTTVYMNFKVVSGEIHSRTVVVGDLLRLLGGTTTIAGRSIVAGTGTKVSVLYGSINTRSIPVGNITVRYLRYANSYPSSRVFGRAGIRWARVGSVPFSRTSLVRGDLWKMKYVTSAISQPKSTVTGIAMVGQIARSDQAKSIVAGSITRKFSVWGNVWGFSYLRERFSRVDRAGFLIGFSRVSGHVKMSWRIRGSSAGKTATVHAWYPFIPGPPGGNVGGPVGNTLITVQVHGTSTVSGTSRVLLSPGPHSNGRSTVTGKLLVSWGLRTSQIRGHSFVNGRETVTLPGGIVSIDTHISQSITEVLVVTFPGIRISQTTIELLGNAGRVVTGRGETIQGTIVDFIEDALE